MAPRADVPSTITTGKRKRIGQPAGYTGPTSAGARLLGELGDHAARDDDGRHRGVADDLRRARAEEDARERPRRARADHEHVALLPLDVLERFLPALAVADDGLELARLGGQLLDRFERRATRGLDLPHPVREHRVVGHAPDAGGERRAGADGERGDPERRTDTGGDGCGGDHEVVVGAGERRRHARHACVGPRAEAARGDRDRHRRAVQQAAVGAAHRAGDDRARVVMLGHLEQAGRGRARVLDDEAGRHVPRQPLARAVERLVGDVLDLRPPLGVHPRRARRPGGGDDRAHHELVARRAGEHRGQVQDAAPAPVGGEADHVRHDDLPSTAWWRP